jgi:hypothetical protein
MICKQASITGGPRLSLGGGETGLGKASLLS